MSATARPSPLHEAACGAFLHRALRGFITFAPQGFDAVVSLVESTTGILIALNAEKLANADSRVRELVNANLGYPDGMGAVLALRRYGIPAERIAGADMWKRLVAEYAGSRTFFLIGSTRPVIEAAVTALRDQFPSVDIKFRDGYLEAGDEERLLRDFARYRPDIVLVGMGSPRQEMLMGRLNDAHPAVYMGVGGSFDVFVGRKARAPAWIQAAGFEWAYQFIRSPRRLRRLPAYARFAWLLATGRV